MIEWLGGGVEVINIYLSLESLIPKIIHSVLHTLSFLLGEQSTEYTVLRIPRESQGTSSHQIEELVSQN